MGRFADDDMETHQIGGSTFQFSAVKLDRLESDQYTLATMVADKSGSVAKFWNQIKATQQNVVRRLRHGPHADNLQLRVLVFDQDVAEVHGFRLLRDVAEDDYANLKLSGGMTALHDATYNAVKATTAWSRTLKAGHFRCNGCLIVITDGQDNASTMPVSEVAKAIAEATQSEALTDFNSILIGVGTDANNLDAYLDAFHRGVGFRQYVSIGQATEAELAKLAGFMSASISSSSQGLVTGGQSQKIAF